MRRYEFRAVSCACVYPCFILAASCLHHSLHECRFHTTLLITIKAVADKARSSTNFVARLPTYSHPQVQKSAKHYTEAARDEILLLAQISQGDPENCKDCVRLLDSFDHTGPNGRHVCMVFDVSMRVMLAGTCLGAS